MINEDLITVTEDVYLGTQTVTQTVYSADAEYIASRIDYQTGAIHLQFAVLIVVLIFLKIWRREK